MKMLAVYGAIALIVFSSFTQATLPNAKNKAFDLSTHSKALLSTAIPINETYTFPVEFSAFNDCTGELIRFSGNGRYQVRGVITDTKITYTVHFNVSNVKGVGETSGTQYVNTEAFNYSTTDNFSSPSIINQQRQTINFISLGKSSNMAIENDWHLTITANGDVAYFF